MIDKGEIEQKSDELGVHVSNVQRDYVFGWLLAGLFRQENPLRELLIVKGGNSFRKAYFENGRFSNDLDFSTEVELHEQVLRVVKKGTFYFLPVTRIFLDLCCCL